MDPSYPIIKDSLVAVLNAANNFSVVHNLLTPITQVSKVRILCSDNIILQANFVSDSLVFDAQTGTNINEVRSGYCFTGDKEIWWPLKTNSIKDVQISAPLANSSNFYYNNDSISICFQFK